MASRKAQHRKAQRRLRVKRGVRRRVRGTAGRPRLTVFRSNRYIYAQLIDDDHGHTLVSASSLEKEPADTGSPTEVGTQVGMRLATRAREAGIEQAVFDRNGYRYQGRVKSVAQGFRQGGVTL